MAIIKLTILGSVPSKKNSRQIFCRGKFPISIPSEIYKAWHKEQMLLIARSRPKMPLTRVSIVIQYFAPNKRATDLDNKNSSICDLLKDAGFIVDDNWFVVPELNSKLVEIDKENPRAIVEITQI